MAHKKTDPLKGRESDELTRQISRRYEHVKTYKAATVKKGKKAIPSAPRMRLSDTKPAYQMCEEVSQALRNEVVTGQKKLKSVFASRLWNFTCYDRYECQAKLPDLSNGCLYVPTDDHLVALMGKIGTPHPCAVADMFVNSFFSKDNCPKHEAITEVVSEGGALFKTCPGGFRTHNAGCAKVTPAKLTAGQQRMAFHGIDVYLVDGVLGLPKAWDNKLLQAANYDPEIAAKREHPVSKVAHVAYDPMVQLKFFVCGKKTNSIMTALQKQVDAVVEAHEGRAQCSVSAYNATKHPTGIKWASKLTEDNVTFINDARCSECNDNYAKLWEKYMPELRFRGGVLKKTEVPVLVCKGDGALLGASSLPWDEVQGSMIDERTLPGGSFKRFNSGKVLVKQLGHFFGLYNTFEGGCDGDGDFAEDTPPEAAPRFGCPVPGGAPTSCGKTGKLDPVNNFMDFGDDECTCTFTKDQKKRMRAKARKYIYHKG